METYNSIEVTRQLVKDGKISQEIAETIFPELKENEDEKVRKEIIKHFEDKKRRLTEMKGYTQPSKYPFDELQLCQDALAWLEKRGEQKVFIPKFRVGDTIRWKKADSVKYTIKEINDKGYMNTANGIMDIFQTDKEFELVEQKPAWSEEDEKMYTATIFALAGFMGNEDKLDWLKSLKERYTWKPSDEQMEYLAKAITTLGNEGDNKTSAILYELRTDLKKLKG